MADVEPISDLDTLLAHMEPALDADTYLFATVPEDRVSVVVERARMLFREAEGWTAVLSEADAAALGIEGTFPCRMISLHVHSSLDAVGFLAALLPALARAGMGVNPVSAYHHDHLFVPLDRADDALTVLRALSKEAR